MVLFSISPIVVRSKFSLPQAGQTICVIPLLNISCAFSPKSIYTSIFIFENNYIIGSPFLDAYYTTFFLSGIAIYYSHPIANA